ncbi:hypothetical protein TrVFT333_010501 [Trichoderma virens FT-333]|nr:hypothetical protein TrVFT333_010501 [Trichoderma virens FT-333]
MGSESKSLESFLKDFPIEPPGSSEPWSLAKDLCLTYRSLAITSSDQFIPTPLLQQNLTGYHKGKCLAIDIGGTNLRVGIIEFMDTAETTDHDGVNGNAQSATNRSQLHKSFEMSWHIDEDLKKAHPQKFFNWIGSCIVDVISNKKSFLGVMIRSFCLQESLNEAKIMAMSKGFTLETDMDLGHLLVQGYESHRIKILDEQETKLPDLKIIAIVNDAVATFITANYNTQNMCGRKVPMSFICATGTNATVSMPLSSFGSFKLPRHMDLSEFSSDSTEFIINTEWEMKGASGPLQPYITKWDLLLDKDLPIPGQQPYDYMTAGRYLGELARLMAVDFFTTQWHIPELDLPLRLRQRNSLTTAFIGALGETTTRSSHHEKDQIVVLCETELPPTSGSSWRWGYESASALREIAIRVRQRATMLTGNAIVAMLLCIRALKCDKLLDPELLSNHSTAPFKQVQSLDVEAPAEEEPLLVGYTGGCIMHFPKYLDEVQGWVDQLTHNIHSSPQPIEFIPVVDGGILGAGILACTALSA